MKFILVFCLFFISILTSAQVELNADGPGNTYALITSVLAPGHNPIEVPDCGHTAFGDHIDELFDSDLNTNVFRFYIHTSNDNDRCINFDRQRNEIKTYDKSPDNLLGVKDETVTYKWKFKLSAGFQSSPNFTHLHQLKSVGGSLASMPMYTLTTRKGTPDRLELRYAETDSQVTLTQTPLAPLIDTWLEVTETIKYGTSGTYDLEIKRVNDGTVLFSYSDDDIINWRPGADFVRPKWGIYRSLLNAQDLRDETVLFANFSIEENATLSTNETTNKEDTFMLFPNPVKDVLYLKNLSHNVEVLNVVALDGSKVITQKVNGQVNQEIDVSFLAPGLYVLTIQGQQLFQNKLFIASK